MAYNPKRDVVAGKTAYQIEAAKRRAVKGKGKKRCKKGKSCGATCINNYRVCMVDLPWVSAQALTKVSATIQSNKQVKPAKPVKVESHVMLGLDPLTDSAQFQKKLVDTKEFYNQGIREMNEEVQKIVGKSNGEYDVVFKDEAERLKYDGLRSRLAKELGNTSINEAFTALDNFTGDNHKKIRDFQRDPSQFSGNLKWSLKIWSTDIEKLINAPVLPKPAVEKFRGFRATPEHLADMIRTAKRRETLASKATASWSTSLDTAQGFADWKRSPESTERVILRTVNKAGVPVEHLTTNAGEYELLTSKNAQYTYLGYNTITLPSGNIYHVFDILEK